MVSYTIRLRCLNHETESQPNNVILIWNRSVQLRDASVTLRTWCCNELSNDLTWKRHVDNIVKKAGKRIYMLYQLKRAGVIQADLVTIYISVVRPFVEYACPVWHTNLPIYLSDNIEMIQKRAVRAIFPGMSYIDILNHINLSTLKERRDYLCKKYFINMQARSHKVNCLLPKKRLVDYNLRHGNMYPLTVTRTNRFKNSLIPWGVYHWQ